MPLQVLADPHAPGSMDAHHFESVRTGVARRLFWSVTVPCLPVVSQCEEFKVSVTCDWLGGPVRDWRRLDGMTLSTAVSPALAECTLYLADHQAVRLRTLEQRTAGVGARFRFSLAGRFDIDGFDDLDGTNLAFSIDSDVEFEGLVVVPENLIPQPRNEAEVLNALRPHVDLDGFGARRLDNFRYVLAPIVGAA